MTQSNYFGGRYVGCDTATASAFLSGIICSLAYSIPVQRIGPGYHENPAFLAAFNAPGPAAFLVHIDPSRPTSQR